MALRPTVKFCEYSSSFLSTDLITPYSLHVNSFKGEKGGRKRGKEEGRKGGRRRSGKAGR
jgi:hypothetical protein